MKNIFIVSSHVYCKKKKIHIGILFYKVKKLCHIKLSVDNDSVHFEITFISKIFPTGLTHELFRDATLEFNMS